MNYRVLFSWCALSLCLFLSACGVRSISDSGYYSDSDRGYPGARNPFYRGELKEFDVLGVEDMGAVSEEEIRATYYTKQPLMIPKGSGIMLVQSGAMFPDDPMVKALEQYYSVAGFNGVPEEDTQCKRDGVYCTHTSAYSKKLRLAAAKGGYDKIVVYWGILETAQQNLATKTVSWIPIVGWAVPDENERMRIRLRVVVVDVRSGQWEAFSPDPIESDSSSGRFSRISADQGLVTFLKQEAYAALADHIVKRYAR